MRSIPLAPLFLAACALTGGGSGDLSYAQVQSLREGTPEEEVVRQYGKPLDRRTFDDGTIALAYLAEDATGKVAEVRVAFGENGLIRWTLAPR